MLRKSSLGIEVLEGRDCPTTLNVNIVNGTLTVEGTDGNDTIVLRHTPTTVSVNGTSYPSAEIRRVVVSAGDGDDVIRDGSGYGAFLYGGDGDDIIYGNGGDDKIYGSSGDDKIYGGDGNDLIWGGGGTDIVDGGSGVNTVNEGSPVRVQANTGIETLIINMVNAARVKAGVAPLAVSNALNYSALIHTQDMVALSPSLGGLGAMQHTLYGSAHPEISDRLDMAGYDTWTSEFDYAENIAYGYTSAAAVMNVWMNSAGHKANILSPDYTEIGVSVRADAHGMLYFTQEFGNQS